jgi:sugar-phosphatase
MRDHLSSKNVSATVTCQGVLFDMDGVLVDSGDHIAVAWRRFAEHHGLDPVELLRASHGRRTVDTLRRVAPSLDSESEAIRLEQHEIDLAVELNASPGAASLFTEIPLDRVGIVTSASRPLAVARLRGAHLPIPPVVVTSEDVSAGKPDPEGYLTAAVRLGISPVDALVIEDAPAGVAAAVAAGMEVIAVATTHTADELADADHVVPTLTAVVARFDGHEIELSLASV